MIELQDITFAYPEAQPVLRALSFHIAAGEKVVLLGANGCGKSTLLKILNGLVFAQTGRYRYQGETVSAARLKDRAFARRFRRAVALLFQSPDAMLFNPTVYDEIAFGPRQAGLDDVEARVHHWAERLGLRQHLQRPPFSLSGGEKQRLGLAALLALEPELLILDEPTANLDPRSTGWLIEFLQALPVTLLVTTHNLSLAPELGNRALVLSEAHTLAFDGPFERLAEAREVLLAANLVHRHRHRHGALEHRHFHLHDWD